jgi:hypothetical protein
MKKYAEIAVIALAVVYLAPRLPLIRDFVKPPAVTA